MQILHFQHVFSFLKKTFPNNIFKVFANFCKVFLNLIKL